MKKLILAALLVALSGSVFAQNALQTQVAVVPSPGLMKATWDGKVYSLTEKEMKTAPQYETTLTFYRDKKSVFSFSTLSFANFPVAGQSLKEQEYISAITYDKDGKPVIQKGMFKSGYDLGFLIIPSDGDETSVLFKDNLTIGDLTGIQNKSVDENLDKLNLYVQEPQLEMKTHQQTSLVPVGREVVVTQWGGDELKIFVKRVK